MGGLGLGRALPVNGDRLDTGTLREHGMLGADGVKHKTTYPWYSEVAVDMFKSKNLQVCFLGNTEEMHQNKADKED